MTTRRRTRILVALIAVLSLTAAACGTRLDHGTIVQAAQESGAQTGTGQGSPGEEGLPDGSASEMPGDTAVAGADDAVGDGQAGQAGTKPGQAGKPGAAGRNGDGRPAQGQPIVIGSVGTYSGFAGSSTAQTPRALQAWAAAVNAKGGINGHPVKVYVYDDGGDGAKARSQVQELVEQRKAVAIVASMNIFTLPAWRGYVEEKKVPVVGGGCDIADWNQSPVLFSQCGSLDTTAFGHVKTAAKYGKGTKFGALACAEADICSYFEDQWFNKGVAKKAGLDPVYHARISLTQPDYTSECMQARNAGVQILSVLADANSVSRVAASCQRQNYNPQIIVGGGIADGQLPSRPGLANVLSHAAVFPFTGLPSPAFQEFNATWKKYGGGAAPGASAALGWASAKLFEKAARAAGDDVTTSAGIFKGLYTIKNDRLGGLTAPLTFLPGKPSPDAKCWFVMQAVNGKWTAPQGDRIDCR